jgi:hypothetical protein
MHLTRRFPAPVTARPDAKKELEAQSRHLAYNPLGRGFIGDANP